MGKIKLLDQNLINQIAAGEVIERPVSVIKELIENSLDAGAKKIFIEVEEGGKKLLKITDDGEGMSKDDLPLALQRHATSKISTPQDLFRITTMGFRGEALASVASVSKLRISSRAKGSAENNGYQLLLEASIVQGLEPCACAEGTTIEVRDLFYNLPARLKFLKTDETELGHIRELVSRQVLARPDVSFVLSNAGNVIMQSQGADQSDEQALRNAIGTVFGSKVARALKKVELDFNDFSISGFVSESTLLASSRQGQVFFVNNRQISSGVLNKALDTAVEDIIPRGKYPYAILFLDIAYDQVDVNVHPAKREVRFADSGKVFDALKKAVQNAYAQNDMPLQTSFSSSPVIHQTRIESTSLNFPKMQHQPIEYERSMHEQTRDNIEGAFYSNQADHSKRILGQINRLFIAVLDGDDLLLVDQHAAHERIIYEQLKTEYGKKHNVQVMLIPTHLDLGTTGIANLREQSDVLKAAGYEWEEISGNSILLRAVPLLRTNSDLSSIFLEMLEELSAGGASSPEKLWAVVACKAAVKDGDVLEYKEMQQLITDLFMTPNYQTCPHGRPTITALTRDELAKRFKR